MALTRRDVLSASAAAAAMGVLPKIAWAAPDNEISVKPAVVVLFLRGGADALNTLVPYTDGRYYDMRPNIAVPPPDKEHGCIKLDDTFGLNPALTGFHKLWKDGILAPIVNAGLGHPSRSHFACQDYMEFGALGDSSVRNGWLNRYLMSTGGVDGGNAFRAVALQARLPRSMRGDYPVLAVPRQRRRGGDDDVLELFDKLYKTDAKNGQMPGPAKKDGEPAKSGDGGMMGARPDDEAMAQNGRHTIDTLKKLERILATKPKGKEVRYPNSLGRLGEQMKMAARILKSGQGVEAIGMDWNGWDTHINEGGSKPADVMYRRLKILGDAISLFFDDIQFMRKRVTMLIMTEFGRTNRENGNFGTDHGHGGLMFAIGGKVKGGKIYGDWPGLAPGKTYQNRDLLVTTDWRTVLSETLYDFVGLHPSRKIFKGFTPPEQKLGLFA